MVNILDHSQNWDENTHCCRCQYNVIKKKTLEYGIQETLSIYHWHLHEYPNIQSRTNNWSLVVMDHTGESTFIVRYTIHYKTSQETNLSGNANHWRCKLNPRGVYKASSKHPMVNERVKRVNELW